MLLDELHQRERVGPPELQVGGHDRERLADVHPVRHVQRDQPGGVEPEDQSRHDGQPPAPERRVGGDEQHERHHQERHRDVGHHERGLAVVSHQPDEGRAAEEEGRGGEQEGDGAPVHPVILAPVGHRTRAGARQGPGPE